MLQKQENKKSYELKPTNVKKANMEEIFALCCTGGEKWLHYNNSKHGKALGISRAGDQTQFSRVYRLAVHLLGEV